MATIGQLAQQLRVSPLVNVQNPAFLKQYNLGVAWSLYGGREGQGPLEDHCLVDAIKFCMDYHYFDDHHDTRLFERIGWALGMIHGAILVPESEHLRLDATTLVRFTQPDAARGYQVGRYWFFCEAEPDERVMSDTFLVGSLKEDMQQEARLQQSFTETVNAWYYAACSLLGELSGHLFPFTQAEHDAYEQDLQAYNGSPALHLDVPFPIPAMVPSSPVCAYPVA